MIAVARDIPLVSPDREPSGDEPVRGRGTSISIPLQTPGDRDAVLDTFITRLWYAARRADLHLDGDTTDDWRTPARLQDALRQIAPALSLKPGETDALAADTRLERYCAGESILRPGAVPVETRFMLSGTVVLGIPTEEQGFVQVARLGKDDAIGITALSRTPTISRAVATSEVDVIVLPVADPRRHRAGASGGRARARARERQPRAAGPRRAARRGRAAAVRPAGARLTRTSRSECSGGDRCGIAAGVPARHDT